MRVHESSLTALWKSVVNKISEQCSNRSRTR